MKAGRVRVVAGSAGGLWISLPPRFSSRPTQDRVKQAIFSSLGDAVIGARVLDLFAGSGSLGIEALSRGAASCVFVESERAYAETIRKNLDHCHLTGRVINQTAETFLKALNDADFTLVFLDPPYLKEAADLGRHPLTELLASRIPSPAVVVWEHDARNTWTPHPAFQTLKQARYGDSSVLFLKKI
ncbi:MAG: 16S rRNA (guanine(966)-N(2))-methyltransferase RsmD [bacterium]